MTEALVALLLFFAMLLSIETGARIGRRRKSSDSRTSVDGLGTIDAAVFGLLGLILAFTFSGASERLVVRRAQIVQEANAIGTAYLRLDLLPSTEQPAIRDLFRKYLDSRISAYNNIANRSAAIAELN